MKKTDTISIQLELMNLKEEKKKVYITMDYEFGESAGEVEGDEGGVAGCYGVRISSTSAQKGKMEFTLMSARWTAPFDGQLLSTGLIAHLPSFSNVI